MTPPQLLNQAPPGAQQLILPDLWNVLHFGHVILLAFADVIDNVLTDVLAMSSRSDIGLRGTYWRVSCLVAGVWADLQIPRDINPGEPVNMSFLFASDRTQAGPQRF